jgi:hypothetical protein
MFSNIGELARRLPSLANGGGAPRRALARAPSWSSPVEGISGSGTAGALTCPGGNGPHATGKKGCFGDLAPAAARDVRGLDPTEPPPAEKAATLSLSPCLRA